MGGEYRAIWSGHRADWKFLQETYRFDASYLDKEHICFLCECTKTAGPNVFTDWARDAPHRQTLKTTAGYFASVPPERRSPLCGIPGWSLWSLAPSRRRRSRFLRILQHLVCKHAVGPLRAIPRRFTCTRSWHCSRCGRVGETDMLTPFRPALQFRVSWAVGVPIQ